MLGRLIILLVFFSVWFSTDLVIASEDFADESSVSLEKGVYVVTADGSNYFLASGSYHLVAAPPWIRIVPTDGQKTDTVLLESTELPNEESVSSPVALSLQGDREDTHHFIVLLPNGKRFETIGTYSGIRSRAGFRPAAITKERIAAKIRRIQTPRTSTAKTSNPISALQIQVATLQRELAALKSVLNVSRGTISITSAKDIQKTIGGHERAQVGRGQQYSIGASQTYSIGKDQVTNVGRDKRASIGKNMSLNVQGSTVQSSGSNYSLSSGKLITISAGDEIILKTSQASIVLKKKRRHHDYGEKRVPKRIKGRNH